MYRLSSIIVLLCLTFSLFGQSPHGEAFKMNCADCHTSESWEIPSDQWSMDGTRLVNPVGTDGQAVPAAGDSALFSHGDTDFPLRGGHSSTDCRLCHENLVFTETSAECISCHTDIHEMTVGSDCARCHSEDNWLVDQITELHQENGFPLLGSHALISCEECHTGSSQLQFTRLGNDCVNCHLDEYQATTEPNHVTAGYSQDCMECHDINAFTWNANINHDFFPLVLGHDIADCNLCHTNPDFSNAPTECVACHQDDFDNAINPNHKALGFSNDCAQCHTLDPDWMPATFLQHDAEFFPIYSGSHAGEWDDCMDCHPNPANYAEFSCTNCHERNDTDGEHGGVLGYTYSSTACLVCHPTGNEDGVFSHARTGFLLGPAHGNLSCVNACHSAGFTGTPRDCAACHQNDFNQTTNPNHAAAGFSMDCAACHTLDLDWNPVNYDHDGMYFPIYSGAHNNEWNQCSECHTTPGDFSAFSCIDCHEHNDRDEMADEHQGVDDYIFASPNCFDCHPSP